LKGPVVFIFRLVLACAAESMAAIYLHGFTPQKFVVAVLGTGSLTSPV